MAFIPHAVWQARNKARSSHHCESGEFGSAEKKLSLISARVKIAVASFMQPKTDPPPLRRLGGTIGRR